MNVQLLYWFFNGVFRSTISEQNKRKIDIVISQDFIQLMYKKNRSQQISYKLTVAKIKRERKK